MQKELNISQNTEFSIGRECGKESRKVKEPKTSLDGTGTVYK